MHHPTDRITHTTAFVTPVVEHWLEREIAQWVHPMKDRSDDPSHHERTLLPRSYNPLPTSPSISIRCIFPTGDSLLTYTLNSLLVYDKGKSHRRQVWCKHHFTQLYFFNSTQIYSLRFSWYVDHFHLVYSLNR